MISETFCVLPFMHFKTGADGKVSPCCRFPTHGTETDFSGFDLNTSTLDEMFHSEQYKEIRKAMLEGRKVEGCSQCYKDEAAGAKSLRMTQNMKYEDIAREVAEKPQIRFLEVAVGNTCNLKCIMCGVGFSYKWLADEKYLAHEKGFTNRFPGPDGAKHIDLDLRFSEGALSELRDIKVVGGEPLLQGRMVDFLDRLGKQGLAKNIALEIYTNCTHWPSEKTLEVLGSFREVQLLFSIDGVGAHDEYIRHPTKWDDVERNVGKWLEIPERFPGIYLSCNYTLNFLNAYYYDRIADWWHSRTSGTPYEKHLETTFVNDPHYLSMSLLPNEAKTAIKEKMERYRDTHPDRLYVKYNTKRILSRLNLEPETSLKEFFRYINSLDSARATDYRKTFPEVYEMIKAYEC